MEAVSDELGRAVVELCVELFASQTASDALSVLRAAAALAASSRSAQTRLGRAFVEVHDHLMHNSRRVVRLRMLAERFLYDSISSVATLALLAVLANDNVVNQRRIARHLVGLTVSWSHSCSPPAARNQRFDPGEHHTTKPVVLLVLSLPTTFRTQYRQWRERNQVLHGHRIPTGVPPSRDGVPASCFCNDCLGSAQLLATWVDHFNDLTRWALDDTTNCSQPSEIPQLSSATFVQRVLESDYVYGSCPCTAISTKATDRIGLETGSTPASIHFFSPKAQAGQSGSSPEVLRHPDPTHHVCAIEIDHSIAPFVSAQRHRPPVMQANDKQQNRTNTTDDEAIDRVLLFHEQVDLQYHREVSKENPSEQPSRRSWSSGVARFVEELLSSADDASSANQLLEVARTSTELDECDRALCCTIFEYLEPHLLVEHSTLEHVLSSDIRHMIPSTIESLEGPSGSSESLHDQDRCDVRISAIVSDNSIEIFARDCDQGTTYAGSIQATMLLADSQSASSLHVLAIPDESLRDLLQHCRLCRRHYDHADGNADITQWLCLMPVSGSETAPPSPVQDAADVGANPEENHRNERHEKYKSHACGLSTAAERRLQELKDKLATLPATSIEAITTSLRRIVHECNDRMSTLALDAVLSAPLRGAARERCRVCRDLIVQAGKRMKLGVEDDATGTLSSVASNRLQREIDRVLQLSCSTDPWEAPDERVEQLHLSQKAWASGVPDPEFYINSEARAKANRAAQRQLNRRLVQRARQSQAT